MTDEKRAEAVLERYGVFKASYGLRALAECDAFWDSQMYGTRLYYGQGITEYLHRSVLRAAVEALDAYGADIAARGEPDG